LKDFEVEIWDNDISFFVDPIEEIVEEIEEKEEIEFFADIKRIIKVEIQNSWDGILEDYEVLEIKVNWYSQDDWDVYVIFFHRDDIPKIENYHWISIKNWTEQVQKLISSLFKVQQIGYSEIYYNENKEKQREFIGAILFYDLCDDIEEEIRRDWGYSSETVIEGDF